MWLIEGRSALEVINTHTTNSDQLVITIADGRPPGGRELVGSDLTISRIGVIPPILTAKHCTVNSASAIEATVRGFIDVVVGFCRAKRTGSTHFLFVGGHGQRRPRGGGGGFGALVMAVAASSWRRWLQRCGSGGSIVALEKWG